jgi:hypothetical protein
MKQLRMLWAVLPTMLVASACTAPSDLSIIVTQARAPGTSCDFSDATKYVEGGAIDMSVFGGNSGYFQVFGWENDLQQISTTVNGDTISGPTVNTFIANRIELSYVLVNGANPPPGLVNISATIPAGGTPDKDTVGVEFLTQAAGQAICGLPVGLDICPGVPPGTSQTLLVTFQLAGSLVGGGAAKSSPVTYPLTLFRGPRLTPPPLGGGLLGTCRPNFAPQTTSCNVPGRDIPYCTCVVAPCP